MKLKRNNAKLSQRAFRYKIMFCPSPFNPPIQDLAQKVNLFLCRMAETFLPPLTSLPFFYIVVKY